MTQVVISWKEVVILKRTETLSFFGLANDLWLKWPTDRRVPGEVWMRYYEESDGRWRIGTVVIDTMPKGDSGDGERGPITRDVLKSIPISEVERFINRGFAPQGWAAAPIRPPGLSHTDPVEMLRQQTSRSKKSAPPRKGARYRLTLMPPDGRLTDAYLQKVVRAYQSAVDHGLYPAPAIADDTGATVRTVRSWIHKARQRGFMRAGLAGISD